MFEILKMASPKKKSIALDTRLGNPIENEIAPTPSPMNKQKDLRMYHKYILKWGRRIAAIGIYNCMGHAWASRRTAIYSEKDQKKILSDDGYTELLLTDNPFPDDLVVYEDKDSEYFLHIGRVMFIMGDEVKILSKWDDSSGEYLHSPEDVPWQNKFPNIRTYYITERK